MAKNALHTMQHGKRQSEPKVSEQPISVVNWHVASTVVDASSQCL